MASCVSNTVSATSLPTVNCQPRLSNVLHFSKCPVSVSVSSDGRTRVLGHRFGTQFQLKLNALSGSGDETASLKQQEQQISHKRAKFMANKEEFIEIQELERPLSEYMSLPASQYSVLDAERIERVDENTFRCYIYRFKFFTVEVCPVLLVRVEEKADGCSINLLSCKLEGSPIVAAQNDRFSASMVNEVSYRDSNKLSMSKQLMSKASIEVILDILPPFQVIPVELIESTGSKVLEQILGMMLPRFLKQLAKDYRAWASGDTSRRPLGTGEI
eukprot:TRINITY_DN702_c0_g1_i1.p1 TRINITY_DN702_c0_g1~~TRINITY_DN702_c0_g1_i1.p1  ORF type:complete len:273 (+),score=48.41 TRINITY_DN702_c0_g1_i1:166-984(+)